VAWQWIWNNVSSVQTDEPKLRRAFELFVQSAITDNELSPVSEITEQMLYLKEAQHGHFRSQVPALVVRRSIFVGVERSISSGWQPHFGK
jgi:hypothetical protein